MADAGTSEVIKMPSVNTAKFIFFIFPFLRSLNSKTRNLFFVECVVFVFYVFANSFLFHSCEIDCESNN